MDILTVSVGMAVLSGTKEIFSNCRKEYFPESIPVYYSPFKSAMLTGLKVFILGYLMQPSETKNVENQVVQPEQAVAVASAQPSDKAPKMVVISQKRYAELSKAALLNQKEHVK